MNSPMIVSVIFVVSVITLCIAKPNAGRIFLGFFFLVMAIGVNGIITLKSPHFFVEYGQGALIPFYRDLTLKIIAASPVTFGVLLMSYEITMGMLLLHKGKLVKIGLIGTMLFVITITPVSTLQFPWLGLIAAQAYLLKKNFDQNFWEILKFERSRFNNKNL